ncbi:MAG: class I SAM-dependent DNA methyltransferase [Zoogloeaceae bacterium]|jgi:hypothetical protein|nr:class I SAM-dependent DNA methyltransferase [Zoogloeaceae bacterium]
MQPGTQMADLENFIIRWKKSGGQELANSQLFLTELCDILEQPHPDPSCEVNEFNAYCYERKLFAPGASGKSELRRVDFYRQGCFVLESKQGQERNKTLALPEMTQTSSVQRDTHQWRIVMQAAKRQGEDYIKCLPATEGRPPFLIVADVGYCFDVYAEFSCSGGNYLPYPEPRSNRIFLDDLKNAEIRTLLQTIWKDPLSLDPSRHAAKVTEQIAKHLGDLARSLEKNKNYSAARISQFLMRCIFSMFAEDVGLIPRDSFTRILLDAVSNPASYVPNVSDLWKNMNEGGYSVSLQKTLLRFNGNIFVDHEVLALEREELGTLIEAARADWKDVEPAIFGTLLERALESKERHKLGAHYTPRDYVERLVKPTVIQPIRAEWDSVQATASMLYEEGKEEEARKTLSDFRKRLHMVRVLDPACGSGNFLYVTMEHMKLLEAEVLSVLETYGEKQHALDAVDPHQFLGLEINPRAAHIAEMVLWIGHLKWHYKVHGNVDPPEPVIRKFDNIQNRDALISYTSQKPATDKDGKPVTRWDGETKREDPVTGRKVPDETATIAEVVYEGVTRADWPEADFIVGNPPFIGGKDKRQTLGHGYFDALAKAYGELPEACDFVMYWWHKAAELARLGKARRFGFITTNSITQKFNRRVVALHLEDTKNPLRLAFAVPDHPWVEAADGAAVRIAMTVGEKGTGFGALQTVVEEKKTAGARALQVQVNETSGIIHCDLRQGADITMVAPLKANDDLCCPGVKLHGSGFIVSPSEAKSLGLGSIPGLDKHIRPYRNGRDIADKPRDVMVIDLYGLTAEKVREKYPEVYQWVYTRVKPERDANNRASYRESWWIFGEPRKEFRPALAGLSRYIATIETAKHRFFVFLPAEVLPDNRLVNIASADAYHLGILSSRIHVCWALMAGGTLGPGVIYNKTTCFDHFPFPEATPEQQKRIRALGESLDAHRKEQLKKHPELTMTGLYNVLEAVREGRTLTSEEKLIHDNGLVATLKSYHDDLDAAVCEAYGWPVDLPDEDILARLVALNAERSAEEEKGTIRYLRPEYQKTSKKARMIQSALSLQTQTETAAKGKKTKAAKAKAADKMPWPAERLEQTQKVQNVVQKLEENGQELNTDAVAGYFARAPRARIQEILTGLQNLGMINPNKPLS